MSKCNFYSTKREQFFQKLLSRKYEFHKKRLILSSIEKNRASDSLEFKLIEFCDQFICEIIILIIARKVSLIHEESHNGICFFSLFCSWFPCSSVLEGTLCDCYGYDYSYRYETLHNSIFNANFQVTTVYSEWFIAYKCWMSNVFRYVSGMRHVWILICSHSFLFLLESSP